MTLQTDLQTTLGALQAGRHKAALKAAKAGMGRHRAHPAFPNVAGIALCGMGRHRDGLPYFKKALALDPGFHEARRNMAQTLILLDQPDPALRLLDRLVADQPRDAGAFYLLAQARMKAGQAALAETAIDQALRLDPKQGRAFNLRALLRNDRGDPAGALADFEAALHLNPDDVETLTNISLPLARQLRQTEALSAITRAVSLAPDHIGARLRLAATLAEMGQTEDAIEQYEQVLRRIPTEPEAIERLAELQPVEANAALTRVAEAALKKLKSPSPARASLSYALARIATQRKDDTAAAGHLARANGDMARLLPYNAAADRALNDRILGYFPDPLPITGAPTSRTPVFVLGLPRSGTTLSEAILGAHPAVQALGERIGAATLLYPMIEADQPFDNDAQARFREGDSALLPQLSDDIRFWVDKMPENYRLIGFLKAAYPHCRIIHMRRDPRDVALSMWRAHFQGRALAYTYDLAAMAQRFNLYAETMTHWHRVLPGQILDLDYETMVADVEGTSHVLADWCGLDWIESMARPDQTSDQILTLSASQLRQPVHGRSVGKWRDHSGMLAPFIAGLDPALWPGLN